MAVRSKALPLTARCISPLPGFESRHRACEKLPDYLGLGGGFRRVFHFPLPLITGQL